MIPTMFYLLEILPSLKIVTQFLAHTPLTDTQEPCLINVQEKWEGNSPG